MDATTEFSKNVLKLLKAIPKGKVTTYGAIAKLAGNPNGPRGVSWLLHSCSKTHQLPWHRVVNSQGKISFPDFTSNHALQKRLLKAEGILLINGKIDLEKHLWQKKTFKASKNSAVKNKSKIQMFS